MGLWSLYFFAKLLLYAGGHIGFHPALNLAFALFTALPAAHERLRLSKNLLAWPLALLLLYHDSYLPPFARVLSAAPDLAGFSAKYLLELLLRVVDLRVVVDLALLIGIYVLARRKLRLASFAIAGILLAWMVPLDALSLLRSSDAGSATPMADDSGSALEGLLAGGDPGYATVGVIDAALDRFLSTQAARSVDWQTKASGEPFDVLILHVCSLSWDDLASAGFEQDPLLSRFQLLFTRFNSAASYSGPAAIRLLRANCGQSSHKRLYDRPQRNCLLFTGLEDAGFEPHWLMNHDGHFGNFFADVQQRGGMSVVPDAHQAATVGLLAFDGTPVYDDYSTLSTWWATRLRSPAPRVALYYNTISLHDGNRPQNAPELSGRASYVLRLRRFFGGLGRFLDDLNASGRRVVVVLVPEHGAAVRGDRLQIEGLREIPTPAITEVPLAVAFIGLHSNSPSPLQRVTGPISYLALSQLLARVVADNPFDGADRDLGAYAKGLPRTPFVSDNEGTVVMQVGRSVMMRPPEGAWTPWDTRR